MTCTSCRKLNLPGGVRCAYCGTALPAGLDFEMPSAPPVAAASQIPGNSARGRTGLIGTLAVLALKGKSLLALLKFGKILTTLSSMFVFIWADSLLFGWKFGAGIAVCIFVHEMGHVTVNWCKGIKQTAPMFIPFVGAVIFIKRFPDDPAAQSESGAGGPAAGFLAALVCLLIAHNTGSPYWFALAHVGFAINLFNLLPFPPLDGSHIATVFSPRIWSCVLIAMLFWVLKIPSAMLWAVLVVGFLFRLSANDGRYLLARPAVRLRMAVVYIVLCTGLAFGAQYTTDARPEFGGLLGSARASRSARTPRLAPIRANRPERLVLDPEEARAFDDALRVVEAAAFVGAWFAAAILLGVAARRRFLGGPITLAACVIAAGAVAYYGFLQASALREHTSALIGAHLAAGFAALIFAGYNAYHLRGHRLHPPYQILLSQCLAWSVGAALLVAYATSDALILMPFGLYSLGFVALHRWLPFMLAASLAESMGSHDRAIASHRRAIRLTADPDLRAALLAEVARLSVLLGRGGDALAALDERSLALAADTRQTAGADLKVRACALALAERYDEALACCEALLASAPPGPAGRARLALAHILLAELARLRGWPDEALAQSEWLLAAMPRSPASLNAELHATRAYGLAAAGRLDEAESECKAAEKKSREPPLEAHVALVRAEVHRRQGDLESMDRQARKAIRALPASLEVRCRAAAIRAAAGSRDDSLIELRRLHDEFPAEHWGREAKRRLEQPVFVTA